MRRHFGFKRLVRRPWQQPSSGIMAVALNTSLESLWLSGREGRLSPFAQLKAVAYRDVMRELGVPEFGMLAKIATKLEKRGGGAPTSEALAESFSDMSRFVSGESHREI